MMLNAGSPLLKVVPLLLRGLLGLAILAVGAGIAATLVATKREPPKKDIVATSLVVGTVPATRVEIPRVWTGYGTARAMNSVEISAQVNARVVERPHAIEAGFPVKAGDLIIQLERTDFAARAEAAQQLVAQAASELTSLDIDEAALTTQLRLAEEQAAIEIQELQRGLDALERGGSNSSEIERRTKAVRIIEREVSAIRQQLERIPSRRQSLNANLKRLRADATLADENLARTTITSPIDGVLQRIDAEQGELLAVGAPVARIVDISRVEVPLRIAASAVGYVRVGDASVLRPDAPAGHRWTGRVARISPEADAGSRTITVFVEVEQDARGFDADGPGSRTLLLPGQFVVGEITGAREQSRLLVPRRAVQDGALFLAVNGEAGTAVARRTPVDVLFNTSGTYPEIDANERQWAVLTENAIPDGAPVIVTNLDVLTDGRFVAYEHRATTTEASQ